MSLDELDRGQREEESEELRAKREKMLEMAPPAQPFKLKAKLLDKGRSNNILADTGNMEINLKVYASGGENGLHNHTDEDHFHLVMDGSAVFFGPRGEELHCNKYEGIMLPAGSYYRFHATSEEPLVLLRVGCKVAPIGDIRRMNIYGDPIPTSSKANGKVEVIERDEYWGVQD